MTTNFIQNDRNAAADWARGVLEDEQAVILDTETTGLDEGSQVIEVTVIDVMGGVLLNTLCKHNLPGVIPSDASRIHGIFDESLAEAPTFAEVYEDLKRILQRASRVIVYNAAYDHRLLNQSRRAWQLPDFESPPFECAMNEYARWYGEWSDYHGSYRWQRLNGGHRALDDCRACLERIREMARSGVQDDGQ